MLNTLMRIFSLLALLGVTQAQFHVKKSIFSKEELAMIKKTEKGVVYGDRKLLSQTLEGVSNGYEQHEDLVDAVTHRYGAARGVKLSVYDLRHNKFSHLHGEIEEAATEEPMFPLEEKETHQVLSKTYTESTQPHMDVRPLTPGRVSATDLVAILFLDDNDEAFFHYGDEIVPVEAGTLVIFDGGSKEHYTEIRGGVVKLLGPMHRGTMDLCEPISSKLLHSNANGSQ